VIEYIFEFWWMLPIAGAGMALLGLAIGAALFARGLSTRKNMLAVASMQNAGYLVLPIGQMVYPAQFDLFAMYCFLFILGYSPLLWSIGKHLTTSSCSEEPFWKQIITPPFVANVLGLSVALTGVDRFIPATVSASVDLLGSATVPVATLILGATLGTVSLRSLPPLTDTLKVLAVKFLFLPLLTLLFLCATGLAASFPVLADLLLIQAASAPATALILQVRKYGGDQESTGSLILLAYLVCVVALPAWLAFFHAI